MNISRQDLDSIADQRYEEGYDEGYIQGRIEALDECLRLIYTTKKGEIK